MLSTSRQHILIDTYMSTSRQHLSFLFDSFSHHLSMMCEAMTFLCFEHKQKHNLTLSILMKFEHVKKRTTSITFLLGYTSLSFSDNLVKFYTCFSFFSSFLHVHFCIYKLFLGVLKKYIYIYL